jgi:putative transposase
MGKTAKPFVLSDHDLITLDQLLTKGKESVRKLNRARVLQLSHQGLRPQAIEELLNISVPTIYTLRKRYREQGLQPALTEKARPGQPRKVTQEVEADITRIACSEAPDGRTRWTLDLINKELVKLDVHIDDESVRLVLKKANSSRGSKSNGVSGR